jgi:DNA-binding NtrC family response regulator
MTTSYIPSSSIARTIPPLESRTLLNLLIVDDDRFVREACREAALALGYSAKATDSADQAFWLVESERVDVVFLAAKASDFNATLQQLKTRRPGIEVVAMINNSSLRFAVEAMRAGAFELIAKLFGLADVKRATP